MEIVAAETVEGGSIGEVLLEVKVGVEFQVRLGAVETVEGGGDAADGS